MGWSPALGRAAIGRVATLRVGVLLIGHRAPPALCETEPMTCVGVVDVATPRYPPSPMDRHRCRARSGNR